MSETVSDVLALRAHPSGGLTRAISASYAVHVVAVVALVIAQGYWASHRPPAPKLMTISLGGSLGPRSTGMNPAGGRPVEKAVPQPKRPEPIPTASSKSNVMSLPVKVEPKRPPERVETALPIASVTKPPTTGREVTKGSALADTGATGQNTGFTIGGAGGSGATLDITDFCCPDYLREVLGRIERNWNKDAPERGETTLRFTILRDGQITAIGTDKTTSRLLENQSLSALTRSHMPPLPPEFKDERLVIHLRFPYGIP